MNPQTPLEGTEWSAQAYNNGRGGVVSLIAGTRITAHFESGRLGGSAGCNRYRATYSLDSDAITIGPAASTRMACPEPPGVMEQEQAYLAALATARAVRIEGNRLSLWTEAGARVANFVPSPQEGETNDSADAGSGDEAKITFDLSLIDEAGLTGPPNGLVAVSYEYCIPATPDQLDEVRRIDPTTQTYPGSKGRIGCGPEDALCIGSTHQPGWRSALRRLTALDYVARIDRHHAE